MTGRLVLMGSGETTPTMVTPHQRIGTASGAGQRVFLDTPYGFQENADELSDKIREYFRHNIGQPVEVASLRDAATATAVMVEAVRLAVRDAAWVFAGPGSPSYVLGQWRSIGLGEILRQRVAAGRTVVLASAAACVAGTRTIPVYEVYKAGFAPWWLDGLDLLAPLGLRAVVVPHWDNAEGGTHDTSKCYLGERRLTWLESELADDEFVLGVDEHTALDIDLADNSVAVHGKGGVTVRVRGQERHWPTGSALHVDDLHAAAVELGVARGGTGPSTEPSLDRASVTASADGPREAFAAAVAIGDAVAATEAVLVAEAAGDRALLRELVTRLGAVAAGGVLDPKVVVAPHVETLLHVRDRLREQRAFDEADHIRGHLTADGVEVRDTPDGVTWDLSD